LIFVFKNNNKNIIKKNKRKRKFKNKRDIGTK